MNRKVRSVKTQAIREKAAFWDADKVSARLGRRILTSSRRQAFRWGPRLDLFRKQWPPALLFERGGQMNLRP